MQINKSEKEVKHPPPFPHTHMLVEKCTHCLIIRYRSTLTFTNLSRKDTLMANAEIGMKYFHERSFKQYVLSPKCLIMPMVQ